MIDDGFRSVKNAIEKETKRFGFMLALRYRDRNKPIGFSLLACHGLRCAALFGQASRTGEQFKISVKTQAHYDAEGSFTHQFLDKFSEMAGVSYPRGF